MRERQPALLAPGPGELPLLFELSRLLGRHADLEEAMAPLLELLRDRAGLSGGVAALLASGVEAGAREAGDGLLRVAAAAPGPEGLLAGLPLRATGAMDRALSSLRPVVDGDEIAVPVVVGSAALGLLRVRAGPGGVETSLALAQGAAALVAEAILLRRRLLRGFGEGGEGVGAAGGTAPDAAPAAAPAPAPAAGSDRGPGEETWSPAAIVGRSAPMRELFSLMDRVAGTETTVLIHGESGTGKELVARAIHGRSARAGRAFVAVNCAALPESVIESELFGHERGAFTGALEQRRGRFELADRGTLLLDEVGELSPAVQAKLLRVLQEGEYQRVGGQATLRADVRVLAATNSELERAVAEGRFRSDLYWRLAVFPLRVPPLRERRSDIVLLADHFAEKHGLRAGKRILRITSPAIDLFMTYHWPGNVRELENCVERAVVLATDGVIHSYHLPPSLQSAESTGTAPGSTLDAALARLEKELVVEALKLARGNAAAAARRLGITERRMGLELRKYSIDWRRYRTKM